MTPLALPVWSDDHLTTLQAMCGAGVAAGPVAAARQIVTAAGWRGLFRGNGELLHKTACSVWAVVDWHLHERHF